MSLASTVMYLREELPIGPIDMAALRGAFGRLMDRAAHLVTLEGRDLDDTVCDRLAELGFAGEARTLRVECQSTIDAQRLQHDFRQLHAEHFPHAGQAAAILLHAAWVRVHVYAGDARSAG